MTKKHFIKLADKVRVYQLSQFRNGVVENNPPYLLDVLADFCQEQNPRFDREKWITYVRNGE